MRVQAREVDYYLFLLRSLEFFKSSKEMNCSCYPNTLRIILRSTSYQFLIFYFF